jgi:hypothetical protein
MVSFVLANLAVGFCQSNPAPKDNEKQKSEKKSQASVLRIEVVSGATEEPVEGANVIITSDEATTNKKLTTDRGGVALWSDAPRVKVFIRVIKDGYESGGDTRTLSHADEEVKLKLTKTNGEGKKQQP